MEENKSLKEIINEQLDIKGFSLERIAEISDIPQRYLEALVENEIKKLPAAPYIRGYLMKIGKILNFDGNELWETFKKESGIKISGPEDKLPFNRFAIKSWKKKYFTLAFIAILLIIYSIWQTPRLIGQPPLGVSYPTDEAIIVSQPEITITGKIDPKDKLTIDNEEIVVDNSGNFSKNYTLQPGLKIFEIKAQRFLGRETIITKQVTYQTSTPQTY